MRATCLDPFVKVGGPVGAPATVLRRRAGWKRAAGVGRWPTWENLEGIKAPSRRPATG
jgi:hypothetical protein